MGESVSKFISDYCNPDTVAVNVRSLVGRKRKRDDDFDGTTESNFIIEKTMHTPKR